ncbi:hypothetical protein DL240_18490 [Lujinxingia litoralis]|uniref:Uncharacterized protein n=1 Tax=Lujinxingia litoralis TaxID=2211119 RepID=A0A328C2Q5_9DELT|nr:hypothetical protein [Lujinxingia litoralis]RAL20205.1 hypothetical protein DL240_18490 [Lujinxingia litoralis]
MRPPSPTRHLLLTLALTLALTACSDDPGDTDRPTDAGADTSVDTGDTGTSPDTADADDASPDADADADTDTGPGPAPGSWQLPEGTFMPAKMPMTLTHPRPEAAAWALSKNAHPGVHWEIPIVVQGGAWPFRYAITDDGGATGLTIGEELERSEDDGFIVHRSTPEYGTLWWEEPVEGTYDITLQVTDQEGATLDVAVSLKVGTEGWLFVDPLQGDDANPGTLDAPFASIARIHAEPDEGFKDHRVYLKGLVPMDPEPGGTNISSGRMPSVWVGFPGSDAVLEARVGQFIVSGTDFTIANLEHRHAEDFFQDDGGYFHMFTVYDNTHRVLIHDVHFSRFHGNPQNVDMGNSSIIMFTNPAEGERNHVAVVNNLLSGDNGTFTSAYQLRYSVFEKNRALGANFKTSDSATWAIFYIKGGLNEFVSLRANTFAEGNQWPRSANTSGALGMDRARNIEFAYNRLHTDYTWDRSGALKIWTASPATGTSWTADTPVWVYRNSLREQVSIEGHNLDDVADGTLRLEKNILDKGTWPQADYIQASDNLGGETYHDEAMNLLPAYRDAHLGQRGAQIAVPIDG